MTRPVDTPTRRPPRPLTTVVAALLPFAVAAALYGYGRTHVPTYDSGLFGQHGDDANELKAQLGSALMALALIQLALALWMYRRLPALGPPPPPVRTVHRVGGVTAFLLSLPIAYHCLTTYGVRFTTTRVAVHAVTGCVLYGAFVAKVLVVRSRRLPGWALPAAGGLLVTAIALMWYTGALWQLDGYDAPGF